jgi:hypothetical protein
MGARRAGFSTHRRIFHKISIVCVARSALEADSEVFVI